MRPERTGVGQDKENPREPFPPQKSTVVQGSDLALIRPRAHGLDVKLTVVARIGCTPYTYTAPINLFIFYYRKRASASYIVREVQSVRERERE